MTNVSGPNLESEQPLTPAEVLSLSLKDYLLSLDEV